jgi:signal transduction histidine kinase
VITRVSDNGPGIPAKLRRKIFGRFVRLGSELERQQTGTGLGLYIVKGLVRRMHGTVQARSRMARPGTVFEVELPGVPAVGVETAEASVPNPAVAARSSST